MAIQLQVTDEERASWRDGIKRHYEIDRDERMELGNPYDHEDSAMQTYWWLNNLCDRRTSEELNTKMDKLRLMAELFDELAKECLFSLYEARNVV